LRYVANFTRCGNYSERDPCACDSVGKGSKPKQQKTRGPRLCQTCWPEATSIIQGVAERWCGRCFLITAMRKWRWYMICFFVILCDACCHRGNKPSARPALGNGVEWRCRCGRSAGRGNDWLAVELVTSARTIPLCNCTRPSFRKFAQLIVGCHCLHAYDPHGALWILLTLTRL
jgi:hypothetical protein